MSKLAAFICDDDFEEDENAVDPEVVRLLVEECLGHSESAEITLLEFQDTADPKDTIEEVLRAFHSLKGAATVVGADQIAKLTHHAELILERCREGEIDFTPALRQELGEHARLAKRVMHQLADEGSEPDLDVDSQTKSLEETAGRKREELPDKATKPTKHLPVKIGTQVRISKKDYDIFVGQTDFFLDFLRTHLLPELTELGGQETVDPKELNEIVEDIVGGIDHFESALHRVKSERFGAVINLFDRYVTDTAQRCDKPVTAHFAGEDMAIERTVLNGLLDPMMHMIRNAVDHGIEDADARIAAGKPAEGSVEISALENDSSWLFEITDDGGGIDTDKLVAKAVDREVISPLAKASMTRDEALALIWEPGLSTAETTTEISGRGMGADIVYAAVGMIGGEIAINSNKGVGTTFTITVPKSASKRLAAQLQFAKLAEERLAQMGRA